ncbi:NADP-dependent malic enzyme [bacterium]|nr:NADP-dependent malic enzyme [bacterium]
MEIRDQDALEYHGQTPPGKTAVVATKPCLTQRQLSLAYTPGVAVPCKAIAEDLGRGFEYTNRGNLVAVVSNGTAVLGLGNIGPLAGKPVMEGKAVLFKRFGHIDVFDLEVASEDPDDVVRFCQMLEPTVGGINLEDIKAPECFYIEEQLKKSLAIPVFHDDQHGTAIIAIAGLINAARLQEKELADLEVVISGAGAAAIACAKLMVSVGIPTGQITLCDSKGVVHAGRQEGMNPYKELFARETDRRTLADAMEGADVFLGCSMAGLVSPDMVGSMAPRPIIFALANPDPEITYDDAKAARPDAIVATGRSDFPNQVNNVLGFPFIFRGALDVRATAINEEMKVAAAHALAELARMPSGEEVSAAYGGQHFEFGPEYIIPKPFDPRVLPRESMAVARAACESGVAERPIDDWDEYRTRLEGMVSRSWLVMRQIRSKARSRPRRIVLADGENERVIEACQTLIEEGLCDPILLGDRAVIGREAEAIGLDLDRVTIKNPRDCPNLEQMARVLHHQRARQGYNYDKALRVVQRPIQHGAMMLRTGEAEGLVCGADRSYVDVIRQVLPLAELREGVNRVVGMHVMLAGSRVLVFADTTLNIAPSSEQLAEISLVSAQLARHFGLEPEVALLSYSNFGDNNTPEARRVRQAVRILNRDHPELRVDGEMHADVAVVADVPDKSVPDNRVAGTANVLIFPDLQSANIAFKLVEHLGDNSAVGPLLYGLKHPINIISARSSVGEIVNMAALSAYEVGRD